MKIAFITEMGFEGKVPANHPNMRTEFAWMNALDADHYNIHLAYTNKNLVDYDHVFIIFPKGKTFLSSEGSRLIEGHNPISDLLKLDLIGRLKEKRNKKIHYVQEGPHWWYNDYEIEDQINFYNLLAKVDSVFVHNYSDVNYYSGLLPGKSITTISTLMIEDSIKDIKWQPEEKTIVGGNFARWYGGFESFIITQEFEVPVFGQTSHATRDKEGQMVNLLPRVSWIDWIKQLSTFKYAVHLMPTIAAGTFSLNCSYLGIPCIGNERVDTQLFCQPELAVDVDDLMAARVLAKQLKEDKDFYEYCSNAARENYKKYYALEIWKKDMEIKLDCKLN